MFPETLFNSFGCFLQSPPFTLPHFNNIEAFLPYIVSSQCIELSLLATTLNTFFSERRTYFLTGIEVVKALCGLKNRVVMKLKPNNTKAVFFLLPACCKGVFIFKFSSCSLKIATHGFKHSIAMRTKPMNTEPVIFFLSACSVEALNFAIRSCRLKLRHYHIFEAPALVLLRGKSTRL